MKTAFLITARMKSKRLSIKIMLEEVSQHLYMLGKIFSMLDIIDLVEKNPDILAINANSALVKRWRDYQQAIA